MGTNYYIEAEVTCNNPQHAETLHIGKRSGGWQFVVHSIPSLGIKSWDDWKRYLRFRKQKGTLDQVSGYRVEEFIKMVDDWNYDSKNHRYSEPHEGEFS